MHRTRIARSAWTLGFALLLYSTSAPADELRYPATEPGRHAREYFPAYNGSESAMRAYIERHVSAADLARRGVDARLDVWRDMRGENGALTPQRVLGSGDDFVEVLAKSEHGGSLRIRFLCQEAPPHSLVALRVEAGDDAESEATPAGDAPASDDDIVARFAAQLDSLDRKGRFSGAVMLEKAGSTLFAKAYGLASRRGHPPAGHPPGTAGPGPTPNNLDTRFNLGSINKIFTHVAIEQLAQAGKLSLDDKIARFLPDYPRENGDRITVRMLLEHRGGVPDVLDDPSIWRDPARVRTMADWYALIREKPLQFEPGTKQAYSNGGFVLLGEIVARVSGEDYYDYVRRHIYEPAGMMHSDHYASDEKVANLATGYTRRRETGVHPGDGPRHRAGADAKPAGDGLFENIRLGRGSPAGGGYATVGDMVRFAQALRGGKLLDAERTRRMLGEVPGLGIAGGSPGCNALLELAGPYTLVVLANLDPPAAEQFARTVGRWLRGSGGPPPGARKMIKAGEGR